MTIGVILLIILFGLVVVALIITGLGFKKLSSRSDKYAFLDPEVAPASQRPYVTQTKRAMERMADREYEEVSITSTDGLVLKGKWFKQRENNDHLAILFHGYHGGSFADMVRFTDLYDELGYDYLIISERTHESSQGKWITFGVKEEEDGIEWVRFMALRYGFKVKIVLHGLSMGAAVVMMMSADKDLLPMVRCVVEDCGYTSMTAEANAVFSRIPAGIRKILLCFLNFWCIFAGGYSMKDASPITAIRHARIPVFFIHGKDDTFVPYPMMNELYEACPTYKERLSVDGAGHGCSYVLAHDEYKQRVKAFITGQMER